MISPFSGQHPDFKFRVALLKSLLPIFIAGLSSKVAPGNTWEWFSHYGGDILYQIFLILLVLLIRPSTSPAQTAIGILIYSSAIECLQLWKPPFLQAIRPTLFGRLVLGSTFSWEDFFYYAIGSLLGWIWARQLKLTRKQRRRLENHHSPFNS